MIQWREKHLPAEKQEDLLQQVLSLANTHDAKVLLNGDVELAVRCGVHGVHLPAKALMALHEKPAGLLCGASCHNADELAHAAKLGLDFVVLSPVLPTRSHPGVETLGWHAFKDLVSDYPLPVYALGGMHPQDLQLAWEHGAHGIAMQRAVWE